MSWILCWQCGQVHDIGTSNMCPPPVPIRVVTCPTCNGYKTVSRPPHVAGDMPSWSGTGTELYPCPTCDARGYIVL
jgi:hypothetical protein